jgi:hypothetical protein
VTFADPARNNTRFRRNSASPRETMTIVMRSASLSRNREKTAFS